MTLQAQSASGKLLSAITESANLTKEHESGKPTGMISASMVCQALHALHGVVASQLGLPENAAQRRLLLRLQSWE